MHNVLGYRSHDATLVSQPSVEESLPQATNYTLGIRHPHMTRPANTDMLSISACNRESQD